MAPTTTATVSGHQGWNGYYTSPVTVNLAASETNVPPSSLTTEYSVNNGPFVTGNQIELNQSGTDVIRFFTKDSSGNVEATQELTVRIDLTRPFLSEHASPTTLWPPNHKLDTVTVSGRVFDRSSGILRDKVFYFVVDEYHQVQPRGWATVGPDGRYSFQVSLQSSRTGQDHDGRHYTIYVVAWSRAGQWAWDRTVVTVPHDQGHPVVVGPGWGNSGNGHGHGQGNGNGHGHGHGLGRG
jgi:hypothetical protein